MFQFMTAVLCLPAVYHCEEPGCVSSMIFPQALGVAVRSSWSYLCPRLNEPSSPSLSSQSLCSSPTISGASTEIHPVCQSLSCIAGAQNWMQYLKNSFLGLLVHSILWKTVQHQRCIKADPGRNWQSSGQILKHLLSWRGTRLGFSSALLGTRHEHDITSHWAWSS